MAQHGEHLLRVPGAGEPLRGVCLERWWPAWRKESGVQISEAWLLGVMPPPGSPPRVLLQLCPQQLLGALLALLLPAPAPGFLSFCVSGGQWHLSLCFEAAYVLPGTLLPDEYVAPSAGPLCLRLCSQQPVLYTWHPGMGTEPGVPSSTAGLTHMQVRTLAMSPAQSFRVL